LAVVCVAALYGCGETSFGSCAENGTCSMSGVDATVPDGMVSVEAGTQEGAVGPDGGIVDASSDALNASDGDAFTCVTSADPSVEPCLVSNTYGVFVSSGIVNGSGTRAAPYNTIAQGITAAAATSHRVFVCAGVYNEPLVVGSALDGVAVYGGFDCTAWGYATTNRVQVAPTAPGYALELDSLTLGTALFEDMEFDAVDAEDAGASSIAVFANQSAVTFRRVVMKAGNGAMGAVGAVEANYPLDAGAAEKGNSADGSIGALPQQNCQCGDGTQTTGGGGGTNGVGDGSRGRPLLDGGTGFGGASGTDMCTSGSGTNGAGGTDGPSGLGASSIGTTAATGWAPALGALGGTAIDGQGGGGGGGNGQGGGAGGGCGGCGGGGGAGGGGGGSSLALLSLESTIALDSCQLVAGSAGTGGIGGAGQGGQNGGYSGTPVTPGCPGGTGGTGGGGGGGGGGAGGISAAIGYTPPAPVEVDASVTTQFGEAGAGGAGGAGGGANNAGGMGINGVAGPAIQL
jgi:hypothetical protein